jgi:hypothetical protein
LPAVFSWKSSRGFRWKQGLPKTMALANHERVGKALEQLSGGLKPFVEREIEASCKVVAWPSMASEAFDLTGS